MEKRVHIFQVMPSLLIVTKCMGKTKQVGLVITLFMYIWEVPILNFGWFAY
jgi:hypothetical protein